MKKMSPNKRNKLIEIFVIKDLNTNVKNCYIEIDKNSGGYPYLTELISAQKFRSKKIANNYMKTFKKENWILEKFIYYTSTCD